MHIINKAVVALYVSVVVGLIVLLAGFYVQGWTLEIIVSQAPLLTAAAAVATASLLAIKIKAPQVRLFAWPLRSAALWPWLLATVLLVVNTVQMYTSFSPQSRVVTSSGSILRYATYNKLYTNSDLGSAGAVFGQQGVDIVSLQEVVDADIEHYMQQLGFDYGAISTSGHSAFGSDVGIVSRYPLRSIETIDIGGDMAVLRSVVVLPSAEVSVYTAHIKPPVTPYMSQQSQEAFDGLAALISAEDLPVLLAGDFNSTVFSPKFRSFVQQLEPQTNLAALDRSPKCSWHGAAAGWPLCMRIDHVFYDKGIDLLDVHISDDVGSDHRVVTTTLAF